jgi:WD40 repeat protein
MYNTYLLERMGVFQIDDSCKSMDISKDGKRLFAAATTVGVKVFDTSNGDKVAEIPVNSIFTKIVELSYSDKQLAVVTEENGADDLIRIFNTQEALAFKQSGDKDFPKPIHEIRAPRDHVINTIKWGPLDKCIYYATDKGRLIKYDLVAKKPTLVKDVHSSEIFTLEVTKDFTMMFSCSRDGFCKLLHPETFEEIRKFNHEFPVRNAAVSPLY